MEYSAHHVRLNYWIESILYLTSKDDDLLDDPGSLFLEELLNDVVADGTGPNDGEFRVSRHEVMLSAVCAVFGSIASSYFALFYLFTF
jgi:hypothetical protein